MLCLKLRFIILAWLGITQIALAQADRWQQHIEYTQRVSLDVQSHRLRGSQRIRYENRSPDTLRRVYFHLYFNAFQPGSMMDQRSQAIADPDQRIGNRIASLSPNEIGYQKIISLTQRGKPAQMKVMGTILEVNLPKPLLPNGKTEFKMAFEAQVPVQIRRCGRDNAEGIAYSMTQWYPKMAEYDQEGWHADQYVGREFHGVWGNFDTTIEIDSAYTVAATGTLVNAKKIGHGYAPAPRNRDSDGKHRWHFIAKRVIDFAWAADPDYTHDQIQTPGGPVIHFFYQKNDKTRNVWKEAQPIAVKVFQYLNKTYGKYPFNTYSVIQGGDGGMEYPQCTLILGEGKLDGLTHTMTHEIAHSWFQMALATNESLHAWMDEGFTQFASEEAYVYARGLTYDPHRNASGLYYRALEHHQYEIPATASDFFHTNFAYAAGSYGAGDTFLCQLKYVMGSDAFYKSMRHYYQIWQMKHPTPNDFVRVMEQVSSLQLHWLLRQSIQSTNTVDYAIDSVRGQNGHTLVVYLRRRSEGIMPIEITVTKADGAREIHYIPLNETLSSKPAPKNVTWTEHPIWYWTKPAYTITLPYPLETVQSIVWDAQREVPDIARENDAWINPLPTKP